ncbi:hypothetical protein MHY1_00067 [Methylovirgula sp. HY1]|nr:hypothetical protein MHY1_00067 [Methylovirgula sp. HY1]
MAATPQQARRRPIWFIGAVRRCERQLRLGAKAVTAVRIGLFVVIGIIGLSAVLAQKAPITRTMVLQDRDGPMAGNPKGDVTIIAFLDYNCPYCKKSDPDLERLIKTDGKIRLIYKDWPILSPASIHGAELALAARYQGKYEIVHDALMRIPGSHINNATMDRTLRMSGVDIDLLNLDLKRHSTEIQALLRHNRDQARALGLKGVPAFLIGPFDEPAALDYSGFKKVVAEVRMLQGK